MLKTDFARTSIILFGFKSSVVVIIAIDRRFCGNFNFKGFCVTINFFINLFLSQF